MRNLPAILLAVWLLLMSSQMAAADDNSSRIRKIGQTLFELQQDYLELKEDYQKQKSAWTAQQEKFNLLMNSLQQQNKTLIDQTQSLQKKVEAFEETVEDSQNVKISKDIAELNKLLQSILLTSVDDKEPAEKLILEVINDAEARMPRDLLILYLARQKEKNGHYEQSLGYYGTLATEFPDSPYVYRSIFAMSNLFGKLGKKTEQLALLNQLAILDEHNPYALLAKEKLKELQNQDLTQSKADASAGTQSDTTTDTIPDATSDTTVRPLPDKGSDSSSDAGPTPKVGDSTSDVGTTPMIGDSSSDAGSIPMVTGKTDTESDSTAELPDKTPSPTAPAAMGTETVQPEPVAKPDDSTTDANKAKPRVSLPDAGLHVSPLTKFESDSSADKPAPPPTDQITEPDGNSGQMVPESKPDLHIEPPAEPLPIKPDSIKPTIPEPRSPEKIASPESDNPGGQTDGSAPVTSQAKSTPTESSNPEPVPADQSEPNAIQPDMAK